jgi:segregation and condensation protein B
VYGLGPKDVKLSQDALEVLALVAYQQPVTRVDVEATGKPNAAALLRQLLRRELIRLERGDGSADDVRYFTTSRFLQLFGLASLDDLPRAEDVVFK